MSSDGSKSFILFSYKPDCPKKKSMSSFITEKEDVFLDNENILENALKGQNTDVDINAFIENMSKEKPVNKIYINTGVYIVSNSAIKTIKKKIDAPEFLMNLKKKKKKSYNFSRSRRLE